MGNKISRWSRGLSTGFPSAPRPGPAACKVYDRYCSGESLHSSRYPPITTGRYSKRIDGAPQDFRCPAIGIPGVYNDTALLKSIFAFYLGHDFDRDQRQRKVRRHPHRDLASHALASTCGILCQRHLHYARGWQDDHRCCRRGGRVVHREWPPRRGQGHKGSG